VDVHQDEIEGFGLQRFDCRVAIGDSRHLKTSSLEQAASDVAIHGLIIDHEQPLISLDSLLPRHRAEATSQAAPAPGTGFEQVPAQKLDSAT